MTMTGMYRITLLPSADEKAFIEHMAEVFHSPGALQATRTTSGFSHTLLNASGALRQYVWLVKVHLVTAVGYDFSRNIERVQEAIGQFAVLTGVDVYTNVELAAPVA